MTKITDIELANKFLKFIDVKPENTKKLFALSFLGTTAVGKSTTSKVLSEKLDLYICSNDKIRRFLNDEGFPGKFPDQELVNFIGLKMSEYLYSIKGSHIIDADMIRFHEKGKANAAKGGADLLIIKLVCPVEIILKRIELRQQKIDNASENDYANAGFSLSAKEEFLERNKMHRKLPLPENIYFTMDTSKDFENQIGQLINKIKLDNYI